MRWTHGLSRSGSKLSIARRSLRRHKSFPFLFSVMASRVVSHADVAGGLTGEESIFDLIH